MMKLKLLYLTIFLCNLNSVALIAQSSPECSTPNLDLVTATALPKLGTPEECVSGKYLKPLVYYYW